jgi:hypothetical protein
VTSDDVAGTRPPDRVDLVDEDDRGRYLARFGEEGTDSARPVAPSLRYFSGCFKKSTTSDSSAVTSRIPATSANVTRIELTSTGVLLFRWPSPVNMLIPRRLIQIQIPAKSRTGSKDSSKLLSRLCCVRTGVALICTPFLTMVAYTLSCAKIGRTVLKVV